MKISINNVGGFSIHKKQIDKLFKLIRNEFKQLIGCQVSVAIIDNIEMKKLNNRYRRINKATDVLSFPEYKSLKAINKKSYLGEIIISYPYIKKQAKENGKTIQWEIAYMLTHGLLHLIGYDHLNNKDEQRMKQKEKTIMQKYDKIKL
ncbi:MAG: rRNA maturation RNase YbeY [Candidatus Kerfeldbacteria bacterium]